MTSVPILAPACGAVLVASPNNILREQLVHSLCDRQRPVHQALGGAEALVKLETGNWQVLYLDRRLPDLDADELIGIIKRRFPGIEVVIVDSDGPGAVPTSNYSETVQAAVLPACVVREEGGSTTTNVSPLPGMVGRAEAMQRVYRLARLVAPRTATVLITGPTGSGKELVASAIHDLSPRSARPFVVVNCAAIPETLLESELFGHARGAFTGAVQASPGRVLAAQGGTLFLDEIGELPLGLQAKLLRFLDQKEIQRLGSTESVRADVRVVAATNADLVAKVEQGQFRSDLYYRLSAFPLVLPSLAERTTDILLLADHFLKLIAAAAHCRLPVIDASAARLLQNHHWPGNARELQQVLERAAILVEGGDTILPEHLLLPLSAIKHGNNLACPGHSEKNLNHQSSGWPTPCIG